MILLQDDELARAFVAELHIHPQTVRYRIGKLRELLGDALDSAGGRFELGLALRARARLCRSRIATR